jgi:kynurenine formamidase
MDADSRVPRFDDLPLLEPLGLRHAWGVWGDGDRYGSLNFITRQDVVGAARLIREGVTVRLDLPVDEFKPPMYGRAALTHTVFETSRNNMDDRLDSFFPQASSQWDGLRHVRCREFGFFGGRTDQDACHRELGVHVWAMRGIVGRGVLLDVAGSLARRGTPVDPASEVVIDVGLLEAVSEEQGVTLRRGDILCVRTGWLAGYRARTPEARTALIHCPSYPGLAADETVPRFLWDHAIAAVAADNPPVEHGPGDPRVGSLHRRLVPMLGYALGELLDFETLTECCAALGRWEFFFSAAPLHVVGGVGSPANALAIL